MHFIEPLLSFLYPPSCGHCRSSLQDATKIFCKGCQDLLTLLETSHRCQGCFAEIESHIPLCFECRKKRTPIHRIATAWEYAGPPAILIQRLKFGRQIALAKTIAAYLVTQWHRLNWPLPDFVVPVPSPMFTHLLQGYNPIALIAESVAKILSRPYLNALSRKSGSFKQSKVSYEERRSLDPSEFRLKQKEKLFDCTILLIDDFFATGATLRCCASALSEALPREIYALTACKMMQ